jgi:HEAT repeat protein
MPLNSRRLDGFKPSKSNQFTKSVEYVSAIHRIVALATSLTLCCACFAQKSPDQEASEKMTAKIELIVHKAAEPLDLSSPSSPVRITSAQIFFDADDITEMQKFGPRAVPVLTKYLLNQNPRVERVAIRLLGAIGGSGIINPLLEVLDKSASPAGRYEALLNLKQAPCSKAVARALLRIAKGDPEASFREQAQGELSWCGM